MQQLLATPNVPDESTENIRESEYKYTAKEFVEIVDAYKTRKPNEYKDLQLLKHKFGGKTRV
jgi:hypothetical protein